MRHYLMILAGTVVVCWTATTTQANTITVNFSQYGIGYLTPSTAQPDQYLPEMITAYNGGPITFSSLTFISDLGTSIPAPQLPGAETDLSGSPVDYTAVGSDPFTLSSNASYLVVKWDRSNGGGVAYDVSSLLVILSILEITRHLGSQA
jgi:hypothetical protein